MPVRIDSKVCLCVLIFLFTVLVSFFFASRDVSPIPGGYRGGVPPLPIPNREVKPACADGTAMQCGRVGSRPLSHRGSASFTGALPSFFVRVILLAEAATVLCRIYCYYSIYYCYYSIYSIYSIYSLYSHYSLYSYYTLYSLLNTTSLGNFTYLLLTTIFSVEPSRRFKVKLPSLPMVKSASKSSLPKSLMNVV